MPARPGRPPRPRGPHLDAIQISGLDKVYPARRRRRAVQALEAVNLRVPAGCIFGLLGPNGAGKTTLVKILLGLVRITRGRALVLETPVSRRRLRRRLGFLPEGQGYPEYLTGRQYLSFVGRLSGLPGAEAARRGGHWLDRVGLPAAADAKIRTYSKGMCQRLGLAAAFLHEPEVALLDEPTDGVDPVGRKEIRDLIEDQREQGRTIFLNSHLLAEVDKVCDQIAIMNHGRLLLSGPLQEVKASSLGGTVAPQQAVYLVETTGEDLRPWAPQAPGVLQHMEPSGRSARFALPPSAPGATELIDSLRAAGLGIRRVQPLEPTLEDRFLALIREDDRRRFGGHR